MVFIKNKDKKKLTESYKGKKPEFSSVSIRHTSSITSIMKASKNKEYFAH